MKQKSWVRSVQVTGMAVVTMAALAACGGDGDGSSNSGQAACDDFPQEQVRMVVPHGAGGGFDAWARLLAPYLEERIGGDTQIRVENIAGGGSMQGVNAAYTADGDGQTLMFTEPGYIVTNQILGDVIDGFDVDDFVFLGGVTQDPFIYWTSAESDINTLADVKEQGDIIHANQQTLPQELLLYSLLDVDPKIILHDATSDAVLSIRRGDADVSLNSLSSVLEFIEAGQIKPIAQLSAGEVGDQYPGYEYLEGIDNLTTLGVEDMAQVFEYRRVLAAAPGTPDCIATKWADALAETLEDPEFIEQATEANLTVVAQDAQGTTDFVHGTLVGLGEYEDVLLEGMSG